MNKVTHYIFQDWEANQGTSLKSRIVVSLFRAAQYFGVLPFPLSLVRVVYQVVVEWLFCIQLPWDTEVGPGLQLEHGFAMVVNHGTKIGANCILRHSTTIGNKIRLDGVVTDCPTIGDRVEVGANVVILGPIQIGTNAVIGAGSVVIKDVPPNAIVAGNPAKVLRYRESLPTPTTSTQEVSDKTLTLLEG